MEQKLTTIVDEIRDNQVVFRIGENTKIFSINSHKVSMRDGSSATNLIKSGDMIELFYDNLDLKAILSDCEASFESIIDLTDQNVRFRVQNSYSLYVWPITKIYNPGNRSITLATKLKIHRVKSEIRQVSYYDEVSISKLAQTQSQYINSTRSDMYSFQAPYENMGTIEAKLERLAQTELSSGYSNPPMPNQGSYQVTVQKSYEYQGSHDQTMNSEISRQSPTSIQIQYNQAHQTIQESGQGSYQVFHQLHHEPSNAPAPLSYPISSDPQAQKSLIIPKGCNPYLTTEIIKRPTLPLQEHQSYPINQIPPSNQSSIKVDYPVQQFASVIPASNPYIPENPYNPSIGHIQPNLPQHYSLSNPPQGNPYNLPPESILTNPSPSPPLSHQPILPSNRSISVPTFKNMLPDPYEPKNRLEENPSLYPPPSQQHKQPYNHKIPKSPIANQLQEPYKPKNRIEELLTCKLTTCGIERLPISSLKEDFKGSRSIKARIDQISTKFDSWRRVRGDGNCYYRAVAVAYLEHLFRYTTDNQEIQDFMAKSRPSEYFPEEDRLYFLQNLHALYSKKYKGKSVIPKLNKRLQDTKFDNGMIGVFRLLAADYLDNNRDIPDIRDFVFDMQGDLNRIVTMGLEAEGIEFHCMSGALGVFIKHISLVDENDNVFLCNCERAPILFILYKKGHYDLLYTGLHNEADGYSLKDYQFKEPRYEIDNQEFIRKFYVTKNEAEAPLVKAYHNEERKASPASIQKGYVKQEISDIPQSISQVKDICLFCNEVKNKDEFYADKICKCMMCLSCYYNQQSLTTCKKCFEPLSMEKLTTCKLCSTKKFDRFMITLECSHSYCKECLEAYIQNQMRYSNGRVSCPDPYCHQMISIEMRKNLTQLRNTQDDKSIRINEVSSSQPHNRNVCSICKYSDAAKFITQLDCNHSFCTDCLEIYLKYKIRNDLVKRKGIECCICDIRISDKILEKVLDRRTYNQYIDTMSIRCNMTVKCPNKHNIQAYRKSAQCHVCNRNFCVVCKKEPHLGVCERKGFLGFKHKDSCPECNKRSKKAVNSFQNYVICKNPDCNTSFCKYCYQRYSPILAHGRSYHKSGCPLYQYYPYQHKYNPLECEECKKLGVICPKP